MLDLGTARAELAHLIAGGTQNRELQVREINMAMRFVAHRRDWLGTFQNYRMCTAKGCLILPEEILAVRKMAVCGQGVDPHTPWFEYQENGPGLAEYDACCSDILVYRGDAPVVSQPCGCNHILIYSDKVEDEGVKVTIRGLDCTGREVRSGECRDIEFGEELDTRVVLPASSGYYQFAEAPFLTVETAFVTPTVPGVHPAPGAWAPYSREVTLSAPLEAGMFTGGVLSGWTGDQGFYLLDDTNTPLVLPGALQSTAPARFPQSATLTWNPDSMPSVGDTTVSLTCMPYPEGSSYACAPGNTVPAGTRLAPIPLVSAAPYTLGSNTTPARALAYSCPRRVTARYTCSKFRQINQLSKPLTNGYIYIMEYCPEQRTYRTLAVMHPLRTSTKFAVYSLRGKYSTSERIDMIAKRRFLPAVEDTDVLYIQSMAALGELAQMLWRRRNRDMEGADAHEEIALRLLREQYGDVYQGFNELDVQVDSWSIGQYPNFQ